MTFKPHLIAVIGLLVAVSFARAETRVAILDFTSDDRSYRSSVAATEFTALVQTKIFDTANIAWVERQRLQLAADELNLRAYGLARGAAAVRIGKWVHADLLVVGRFTTNPGEDRILRLQVVDLARADVLSEKQVLLKGDPRDPVPVDPPEIERAAASLKEALHEAGDRLEHTKQQTVIAPLFFKPRNASPRQKLFEQEMFRVIDQAATATQGVRVLRFLAPDEAVGEAELVVLGLSDADYNAWRRVADLYVWGSYEEWGSSNAEASLSFWDGQGEVRTMTETATAEQLPGLIDHMAQAILAAARNCNPSAPVDTARLQVAQSLLTRAVGWPLRGRETNSWNGARFVRTNQKPAQSADVALLDLACFLAPQDEAIQKKRLETRWPGVRAGEVDFWQLWAAANDYGRYAERFALKPDNTWDSWSVDNQMALLGDLLDQIKRRDHYPKFPVDVPGSVADQWQNAVARDFVVRALDTKARVSLLPDHEKYLAHLADVSGDWLYIVLHRVPDPEQRVRFIEAYWPLYRPGYIWQVTNPRQVHVMADLGPIMLQTYASIGRPERARELLAIPDSAWDSTNAPSNIRLEPVSGANLSNSVVNQWTADFDLITACKTGDVSRVILLITKGANSNLHDENGWPVIVLAAAKGHVEVVRKLLENGAEVNAKGPGGWTALMQAARANQLETVRLLVEKGAAIALENKSHVDALDAATDQGREEVANFLRAAGEGEFAARELLRVTKTGRTNDVAMLLSRRQTWTAKQLADPLDTSIFSEWPDMALLLLAHGADVNHVYTQGKTPLLMILVRCPDPRLVRFLIENGADVNAQGRDKVSALALAQRIKDLEDRRVIIKLLEDAGAKP